MRLASISKSFFMTGTLLEAHSLNAEEAPKPNILTQRSHAGSGHQPISIYLCQGNG